MAVFLAVAGIVAFVVAMLGLIWGLERGMTVVQGVLLTLSAVVFIYLGVALFKAEARDKARRKEKEIRELFQLSDLLVEEKPLDVLLSVIVTTLADVFGSP